MARYTGAKWRINRREGATVLGAGEKWRRRLSAPGQFPAPKKRPSEYAIQFREKQKVKRTYGMQERQFRRFYDLAQKAKGNTGTRFLQLLEMRADNVLYRLGFANTRAQARQLVTHGHVLVNGRKHSTPSSILKPGDEITVAPKTLETDAFKQRIEELKTVKVPAWMEKFTNGGKVTAVPTREMMDQSIKERMIVELYSK